MTVSVLRNQVQYTGNGSTTAFTVNFPYTEKSQIKVYLGTSLQTITTHYTLTDPDSTGTVTFLSAPADTVRVTILRETDFLQTVDYANNDILDAETLESAFDKLTMMCQQVKGLVDKSVGFDETVSEAETVSLKLASGVTELAGKLLAFDDSGNFVTTQEIGTFKGDYSASVSYVVRDLVRDASTDNVYFTLQDAAAPADLTDTDYFELLVDVETVRTLKVAAETARTGAETAETNAEAALASFQGQYKTGSSNPYTGTPDQGDLWYDTSASILKYYNGSAFEPVTTSLATVTGNYLTISNQVITAGTVPVSLGGTGSTNASDARTALGLGFFATRSIAVDYTSLGGFPATAEFVRYVTYTDDVVSFNKIDLNDQYNFENSLSVSLGGTGASTASGARTALGLEIGTDVLSDIVTDTSPQLGGNLDVNGNSIVSASAGNINITPDGAGKIVLDGLSWPILDGVSGYVLKTDGSGNLSWTDKNSGAVTSLSVTAADEITVSTIVSTDSNGAKSYSVSLTLDATNTATHLGLGALATQDTITESQINDFGTYQTADQALTDISGLAVTDGNFIVADGTNWVAESGATARASLGLTIGSDVEAYSSTNADYADTTANFTGTLQNGGSNVLVDSDIGSTVQAAGSYLSDVVSDTSPQLGGDLDVNGQSIVSVSAGNIAITPDTTGKIILDGLSWPTADGSADQVLKTDGSGNLSFVDQSGGAGSGSAYIEHSSTVSDSLAISSETNRMYVGNTSFSGSGDMEGYLVVSHGYASFSGASALNVTGTLRIVG